MTAAHVVVDAVGIRLVNGSSELQAEIVGIDHADDIALLEASGDGIEPLAFADADIGLGQSLAALGFPLYIADTPSVTTGVVSHIEQQPQLGTVVLTDTAVNPGNSGGPLIDMCGAVPGMVVQKWVEDDVEGISYAIAASTLKQRIDDVRGMTPSVGAVQPTGTDWEHFEGENIRGKYTGVATSADVSTSAYLSEWLTLFVRCTNSSSLDIFFGHDGTLFFGDDVWVLYRFGSQTDIVGAWGNPGTGDGIAFLLDPQSFVADLRADASGTPFVEFYDHVAYTYIEDTYGYEGGGELGVRGVAQDVEPILQDCGY